MTETTTEQHEAAERAFDAALAALHADNAKEQYALEARLEAHLDSCEGSAQNLLEDGGDCQCGPMTRGSRAWFAGQTHVAYEIDTPRPEARLATSPAKLQGPKWPCRCGEASVSLLTGEEIEASNTTHNGTKCRGYSCEEYPADVLRALETLTRRSAR